MLSIFRLSPFVEFLVRVGDKKCVICECLMLVVNIRPLKTDKGRKFVIVDDDGGIPYVQLFKKYLSLRPSNVNTDRVFLKYESGRCIRQVVGINTFGKCPSLVARFLNLPDPDKYTDHAFR
jgi:hypothetical protein